jgi:hypothetical protein
MEHSENFLNTEEKRVRALELVIQEIGDKKNRSGSLQVESIVWQIQKEIDDVFQELEEYARCILRSYK